MTKKKFTYKVPSMVALTLAGTALTTHQAQAADDAQNQSTNGNVLDDKNTLKQSEQIKSEVSKPTANISGTQSYQDPTQVQQTLANEVNTYDAELDELNSEQTPSQDTYNQQTEEQANTQSEANEVTENNQDSENAQSIEQNSAQDTASSDVNEQQIEEDTSAQNVQDNEDNSTDDTTTPVDNTQVVENSQPTEQNSAQDNASSDVSDQQSEEDAQQSEEDNSDKDVQYGENTQPSENNKEDSTSSDLNEQNSEDAQQSEEDNSDKDVQDDENTQPSENNKEDSTSSDLNEQDSEDAQQSEEDTSNEDVKDGEDTKASEDNKKDNTSSDLDEQASEDNKKDNTSSDLDEQDSEDAQQSEEDTSDKDVQDDEDATASEDNKEDNTSSDVNTQNTIEDSNATSTATAVAPKSSAPSATATTLSPEATPKLRVASADTNNTFSTRAAVTKEAGTTSSLPAYTPQVNSSLNDYIRNNNFVAPTYEQDIASFLPQYSYRYGKPEGIVLHETANDNSTITGEINYMKNNYNSAFVHAYIDGDRIIETANTDYLAWGAGPAANDRFIHVELVHTHDYDSFARSINNYADYAATNLLYYGLSPDSAEYDGQGTVWTHQAVSTFLGGSNHTDPHGYLASFNYSYDELYDLIYEKYLIKTGQVAPWGESSSGSTSGSDDSNENVETDTPDNNTGSEEPDNTGNTNEPSNGSGSVEDNDNTANNDSTSSNQLTITELTNKQGTVSKSNHGVYTSVYDKQGVQKSYVNGNTFKLSKKAMLGNNGFYLITDNDTNTNLGWMQTGDITVTEVATKPEAKPAAKPVTKPVSNNTQNQTQSKTQSQNKTQNQTQSVSKIGQLNNTNSGIKTTVNDTKAKDASKLSGRTFNVTKQRTQGDNTYVLIQNANQNTPLGWVNTKDINTRDLSKTSAKNGQFTVKSTNNGLYAVPWGTKSQQLDSLKNVKNNQFNASKSVQVDKDEYVYGNVNNKTGWIAAKDLNTNTNQNNKVVTEAQTSDVTKSAVTPYKFDYVIYNADGSYYLDPTSAQPAGSLKDFYESIFTVFEKQVINGVTWYHGKLSNGQMVWIKEEDLRKELIKYYQSGLTLDEAVAIQAGLKTKPQIQHTPGKWEDATPIEIKNAMDTGKLAQDPTQKYQFLRLDKSQDISSADLDKLLVGKGILEGQGEAFSEAAKAYNINEVYLISHALLETGDGTSELANGGDVVDDKVVTDGPNKYYNMFGIGAVDSDAVKQGFATAKSNGWDTVKKAIVGGAKFISSSYISQGQNTLYKMRWNPENPGEHQYATDVRWAEHNATRIKGFYDSMGKLGKYFDVNTYKA
ncbi:MAG: glucosaminidase domain-containing protein [Staphylococcus equorum]|uniref:glucosaminidase domain-containing protein n=1 Tax=Staphylococcus TaxID=1279 RepID=UPI0025564ADC|nr:GW dipeptide domain-containing protein [Staphylococcus equorum]MDK9876696.1 glucosaminidase domain-containing protein [Staphylococcus equorum]MDN6570832.1 glucosaminidase domain-containing protein [Staphylococcus equorum]MDN6611210.1 glucosaminidase domain-containing protein [Staphylococcus equorum]